MTGYYVNVTLDTEIPDKVVKYLNVLSRPLNMDGNDRPNPIWTGAYIHMADRRLPNYMWKLYQGDQQIDVYSQYTANAYREYGCFGRPANHYSLAPIHVSLVSF